MRNLVFDGNLTRLTQARITFTDYRPRWSGDLTTQERLFYDVGVSDNGNSLMVTNSNNRLADYYGTGWREHVSHPIHSSSPIHIYAGYCFYLNPTGFWAKARFNGSGFDAAIATSSTQASVPVSMNEGYSMSNGRALYINYDTSVTQLSSDTVYGITVFQAVKLNGVGYLYMSDRKRTWYMKHQSGRFSEPQLLIPMDVVDDITQFDLGGATVINGQVYITGTILRKNLDKKLHVMFVGPERVEMGREMVVAATETSKTYPSIALPDNPGKLYKTGQSIFYRSRQYYAETGLAPFFGDSIPAKECTVGPSAVKLSYTANQPAMMQAELRASDTHAAIRSGSRCKLEVKIGSTYQLLGTFSVDVVVRPRDETGKKLSVIARSEAFKKLDQWESDAPFDFWSQTKLSANVAELAKVIRVKGEWKEQDGALYLDKMNKPGFLYLSAKSCNSGIVRALVTPFSGITYRFGLGMYYSFEGKYDAAARLGKSVSDVRDGEAFNNGLFVIYENGAVTVRQVIDDVFTTLQKSDLTSLSVPLTLTAGSRYWIQALFRNGRVTVHYRLESSAEWIPLMDEILSFATYPWREDGVGRAAIYAENLSNWSYTPGFTSSSGVLVAEPAEFTGSETVEVGEELISHAGATGASTISGSAEFKLGGDVYEESPLTGLVYDLGDGVSSRYRVYAPAGGDYIIETLSFRIIKVGDPGYLTVGVRNSGGTLVQSGVVQASEIKGKARWITVRFSAPVLLNGECQLYIECFGGSALHHYKVDRGTWGPLSTDGLAFKTTYTNLAGASPLYVLLTGPHVRVNTGYPLSGLFYLASIDGVSRSIQSQGPSKRVSAGNYETIISMLTDFPQKYGLDYPLTTNGYIGRTPLLATKRGAEDTVATAHSAGIVSVYSPRPSMLIHKVQFYSTDIDMTLADVASEICGKAGVQVVTDEMWGTPLPTLNALYLNRGELIVNYEIASHTTGHVQFNPWLTAPSLTGQYTPFFRIFADKIEYFVATINSPYETLRERFLLNQPLNGKVRVSFYQNSVSIWNSERLVHTFRLIDADERTTIFDNYIRVYQSTGASISFHVPHASQRIDNYIMDNGKKASALLNELAGRRKIFFTETPDGKIRLFRSRTEVNTSSTPYRLAITTGKVETDVPIATRIRLEGGEVYETISDALWEHGNVFTTAHVPEINTMEDVGYFTNIMLEDAANEYSRRELTGAANFRIEPQDIVYVKLPDTTEIGHPFPSGVDKLIVDSINIDIMVNDNTAQCDMIIASLGGIV